MSPHASPHRVLALITFQSIHVQLCDLAMCTRAQVHIGGKLNHPMNFFLKYSAARDTVVSAIMYIPQGAPQAYNPENSPFSTQNDSASKIVPSDYQNTTTWIQGSLGKRLLRLC